MAAGLGYKEFAVGEVLSAANVNGYLMQGVLVFADATARDAAITSPQEGQFAFTKNNDSLWYYSGSAWVASGATGDIEGVTAGTGISGGGTSGTVTITNSMATAIDAKGDLVVGTGADTFARLAVGTNGHTLVADSAEATGLKWAAPAGGATFAGCYVYTTTITSVANDTYVKIPFNAEEYDTNGYHDNSTNNTRMTIPSGKGGYYQINVATQWGTFAEAVCRIAPYVNNVLVAQNSSTKTNNFRGFYTRSYILNLAVGDYLEIAVMQGSGNTQDLWGDDSATRSTSCSIGFLGA
jgi:hypothetical protein